MNMPAPESDKHSPDTSRIEDLRMAASKMSGAERRSFQAAISLKYCNGVPRQTERMFGRSRDSVEPGLHEKRTGITCPGARKACRGNKLWEEKHPDAAAVLWKPAESQGRQDPIFRTALSFTGLTAAEALRRLRNRGLTEDKPPSPGTMADALSRNGCRLRPVIKAGPQKKFRRQTRFSPTSEKRTDKGPEEGSCV
ncbi:hypothetical protein [Desulfonema magnum]|uniref:Uncharacterized protein n=1 Tax=Desulfonema magnum TaxID=45655 RepID=A0A975BVI7_9BACT|nr:hypothetical protein [Desulfonema magnum]QTA92541.1 Uncharacterized protein dnm_086240 [Desulfonema magnum]